MPKLLGGFCVCAILLASGSGPRDMFAKYKAIEAYEIRPGTIVMPRYSNAGEVYEIGLSKQHYSLDVIRLDSSFSREEIDQLVDELVPAKERGRKTGPLAGRDLITVAGRGITTTEEYENVSILIYGAASPAKGNKMAEDDVAAVIRWRNRQCE